MPCPVAPGTLYRSMGASPWGGAFIAAVAAILLAGSAMASEPVRVATFNVSLYGRSAGQTAARLQGGDDPQARSVAEIIQRVRPDILLLNEIDFDEDQAAIKIFLDEYLAVAQGDGNPGADSTKPIEYPHVFAAPVNTGIHSGLDLNGDGTASGAPGSRSYGADAWGFGLYPGQYGMAVLSQWPIEEDRVRTFRKFLWKDMPGALLPDNSATDAPFDWYSADALDKFPLSSKSHWDVPVNIDGVELHILASHPTPPVFDGPEDRNGRRNHDEIRFWLDYTGPPHRGAYLYDDQGRRGPLGAGARFVIVGDLNGDPHDGQGSEGIAQLLTAPQILKYPPPASAGARQQAAAQAGANTRHQGDAKQDTHDAADGNNGPGNLRLDYVLPSANLAVTESGVFWPADDQPHFDLVGVYPFPSSDHRLVWVDLLLDPSETDSRDQAE